MTLRYFGRSPPTDRRVGGLQLLGRLVSAAGLTETPWRFPIVPGEPPHPTLMAIRKEPAHAETEPE